MTITFGRPVPATTEEQRAYVTGFVRLWAVTHLVHVLILSAGRMETPWAFASAITALVVLVRPSSMRWFVAMAVAQLAHMVLSFPFSPDHWMLIGFVNLAFLLTFARRRSFSADALPAAFSAARVIVLVGYGAAALSKYNTTFLDPVMSCARAIAGRASYGLTDHAALNPVWVGSVLAAETAVVVMLTVPATRRHGVRFAMAFHFMLSASPAFSVVDFTTALYALFYLFLTPRDTSAMLARAGRLVAWSSIVRDVRRRPAAAAVVLFVVCGLSGWVFAPLPHAVSYLASEGYLVVMLLAALTTWRLAGGTQPLGRPAWIQVPAIILIALWAAQPYLGLRTTGVFTMFSGLRTEGTAPNHLFMPSLDLAGWQGDLVIVTSSNDKTIEAAARREVGVPLMELRRMAMDEPGLAVTGTLHGKTVSYGPGHTTLEPLGGLEARLMHFRPVSVGDVPFCSIS